MAVNQKAMKLNKYRFLLGLVACGKANDKIKAEIQAEAERLTVGFKTWEKQVDNFLFFVDKQVNKPNLKRELYYRGLDAIEAGEILAKD